MSEATTTIRTTTTTLSLKPFHQRNPPFLSNHKTFPPLSPYNFSNCAIATALSTGIVKNVLPVRVLTRHSQDEDGLVDDPRPVSVELEPVSSETHFDRVVAEAQQQPIVILWMANWCRKCIYLKPKLEKLAADYYPRIRFYCVDVNNVSHKLVACAEVTKMPTIQLWKDGKIQGQVIGGHKAYLVVNEVRDLIENEFDI